MRSVLILLLLLPLCGCSNVDIDDSSPLTSGIRFEAVVGGTESLSTRANTNTYNVTSEFYDCDFFVHLEGRNNSDEDKSNSSTYVIPSGYEGTITPKDEKNALNWFSRISPHDFWGWTLPSETEYTPDESKLSEGIKIKFQDTYLDGTSNSSASSWKDDSWKNGSCLEQMIGAQAGPYTYNENGMYVPLQFRHLVSKIILSTFLVIDNVSGTTTSNLKGTITFYGMPDEATFYPTPRDEAGNAIAPYMEMPSDWDYDKSKGVTYAITNSAKNLKWEGHDSGNYSQNWPRDCWYICPEVDFSKLAFKIELYEYVGNQWILSQSHGKRGAYYGDFKNVTFSRSTTGNNYDNTGEDQGKDATILHAGEYLQLNINLNEKGNPGVQGVITEWSGNYNRAGSAHVEQGIYSVEEYRDLVTAMRSGDEDLIKEYYQIYGSGKDTSSDPEGEYPNYEDIYGRELDIFELYDDIGSEDAISSSSTTTSKMNYYCNIADGYILDGRGHTVNCNSSFVYIGPVRDVYFREYYYSSSTPRTYYEYIVYVDKMGQVWTVDPETYEYTMTEYNVLNGNKNPVTLYLSSGKVS